ncbi:uncharacterized protein LOC111610110 [Xiphophorus maculatus]|uniref:uncharacterized protein LOC111610110 n=1 Tax=Xiphophorus maculatus TaxID=8083 RepID=UPI000C6E3416|nr:uncharacterized protein LOC111610110 [Xiphophorus maculatus]XP_032409148.1 uncharacterized protein LOC116713194 isoform X2 [Xiphophorus hellerii]XP_032410257.1 uncharacterized protein LOC116714034 isoform X2 [Xiphophorus hellerii]XP_032410260.1 uncharacterized protein LOC116714034 isoform X2 [Xiphophorus hellerii]XP_032420668.1 uncharacterized protein LOC116721197 isoform X2 [Xiphophorus hellerii]XP_032428075.1 uncharacterized protein LOC116725802 isoform X2 [Xiphophorus hellerii]XP_032429
MAREKLSVEERKRRNREYQKRRREKINSQPELKEEFLRKERKRWRQRVEEGKIKHINNLGERDKRRKRRLWKQKQKEARERRNRAKEGSAKLFFDKVSNSLSGVKLQFVTNEDFQSYDSLLLQTLKSIPGTRNIHQVLAQGNVIHCRFLSCFCGEPQICKCFSPTIHSFGNTTQDPDVHESSTTAKVQNPLEMLMEEMEKEPSKTPKGTTTLIDPCDVQSEDWLVVMYDGKWWLAKALQIDKEHEDVQVEFFHPHGPTLSFKQKQGRRDICFVPFSDVLVRLRKPSSPVRTSSTRGVYRISPAVMDFIEGEYVTRLLPGD